MGVKTRKLGNINDSLVEWQSKVTSDGSTVTTMVAGRGYFVDNTSAAGIVKLPATAALGDTIAIKDFAGNFGTNNLTIQRNGHNIQALAENNVISTNRASIELVYSGNATKGWLYSNESNPSVFGPSFISATGGTVSTVATNFKVHVFTGDGNFVVSQVGGGSTPCAIANKVSYVVVAGGGSGGRGNSNGGGGGAGGFREGVISTDPYAPAKSPIAAPDGLTISAQTYPITVGGGAATNNNTGQGSDGSNSVFSTITSTGGGGGGSFNVTNGRPGGSGGGAGGPGGSAGSGNTPPVSPPQGNNGGSTPTGSGHAGGGGAGAVGNNGHPNPNGPGGDGGAGVTSSITGSPVARAGGGGGGYDSGSYCGGDPGPGGGGAGSNNNAPGGAGSGNTGGGGGGNGPINGLGGAGGKGVVIIRYKFQ